ncbi:MAG: glycosyltransferase family 4 protein [Planctomycetes bacterium]|nr:glycosyltransferase family 4 protein [Planctomycetota bacterium]
MRIGIQLLSLKPGQVGGHEVFIRRLIHHMLTQLGDDRLVLFLRPQTAGLAEYREVAQAPGVETIVEDPDPHHGPAYADWNLGLLDAARLDAVYFPLSFFFPRPLPFPVAVHIADIQYEYFPEYFPPEQLAWRRERIPESVALADAVITHTQFSADCIREKLDAAADKLHIVPPGGFLAHEISQPRQDVSAPINAERPFIYYPAADWPHKNHETLLNAVAILASREVDVDLVLTGMLTQPGDRLQRLAASLKITDRVRFLGHVSQPALIELYRNAAMMAFPSRFEGFGLPLVEAMQLDCPIVASQAGAVVEVAGGAALHCTDDATAWADAIAKVLTDADYRDELIRRGRARAAQYDWTRCAARHLEILRSLANE